MVYVDARQSDDGRVVDQLRRHDHHGRSADRKRAAARGVGERCAAAELTRELEHGGQCKRQQNEVQRLEHGEPRHALVPVEHEADRQHEAAHGAEHRTERGAPTRLT